MLFQKKLEPYIDSLSVKSEIHLQVIMDNDNGKVREFCYKSVKMNFVEKVRENQFWSGKFLYFIIFVLFFLF